MSVLGRLAATGALVAAVAIGMTPSAHAQGVTTAAIRGTITREGGTPVDGAIITLINVPKGTRLRTSSAPSGRYSFENVESGGPYTIEITAIGYEKTSKTGVLLTLGQRSIQDFEVKAQVVVLQELEITATTDPLINSARTGPQLTVSDSAISRIPLLGRNWNSLLATSPQVVGTSIAGQNNRFNNIQIDGSVNNDLFGLSSGGTPGGSAGVKPLSLEAIKEFQVLVAPYDVRQGGFTGGLVNGITKSGTNEIVGSLFAYFQNQDLVGKDTAGLKVTEFLIRQYGGSIGGPIIKDKLHFFAVADIQGREAPFFGPEVTEPSTGITAAQADRVTAIIRDQYGFDPGTYEAPVLGQPNTNVFGKLSGQVSTNHLVEVSYNYVTGDNDQFSRGSRRDATRDGFQLSNSGNSITNSQHSLRGKWLGQWGNVSSEVIAGYQTVTDNREMPNITPQLLINADGSGNYIAAGGERFSHNNRLDQDILEFTANVTVPLGRHALTGGLHAESFDFVNVFWEARYGVWTFGNIDSLALGRANRYEIIIPGAKPGGPVSDFGVVQLGGYLQDQWAISDRFTLTAGLRLDVPNFKNTPTKNEALAGTDALGNIDTSDFPTGNVTVSPRLGFNWDLTGRGTTILRGGVGIFSGRPPYVWMSNNYTNTGGEQLTVICTGAAVPGFTVDPNAQPTACAAGAPPSPPSPSIVYTRPDFKYQQALKYSIGLDHQLPGGVVASLDFLHTRNQNIMYLNDLNLKVGGVTSEGRQMYGAIGSTGSVTPDRQSSAFRDVIEQSNETAGYNTLLTAQLAKRFGTGLEFNAAYTYSETRDVISQTSSRSVSNFRFTVIDGTLAKRNLRPSSFDVPHKLVLAGTANAPLGFAVSLAYTGTAGTPYAYVSDSDLNADGQTQNDAIYVPTGSGDISLSNAADWDRLNLFIASQECLAEQRGKIMERGSCRNPWTHFVDFRLAKRIGTFSGQAMEISADIFNLLNLIDGDWGINRLTQFNENQSGLLRLAGWDATNNRPRYSVNNPINVTPERVDVARSRWRMQFGVKYVW
jgi:hypothetical protein